MRDYARSRVSQLEALEISGYVLKKDSPSCGMERVRMHPGRDASAEKGSGCSPGS